MNGRSEPEIIREALDHLAIMEGHRQRGNLDDLVILDAICLRLASAIESLARLPESRRTELFGDDWPAVWSTRNRIAHAYVQIDQRVIAATLEHDIPGLIARLIAALQAGAKSDAKMPPPTLS